MIFVKYQIVNFENLFYRTPIGTSTIFPKKFGKFSFFFFQFVMEQLASFVADVLSISSNELYLLKENKENLKQLKVVQLRNLISTYNNANGFIKGDGNFIDSTGTKTVLLQKVSSILYKNLNNQEGNDFLNWNDEQIEQRYEDINNQKEHDMIECPYCAFIFSRKQAIEFHIPACVQTYSRVKKKATQFFQFESANDWNSSGNWQVQRPASPSFSGFGAPMSQNKDSGMNFKVIVAGAGGTGKTVSSLSYVVF